MTKPSPNTPPTAGQPLWMSAAVAGIFGILLLHTLVWASDFLIPVTAAFLGYFVLNRPRRWLAQMGIPPVVAALLFTSVLLGLLLVLLVQLSAPTADFIEDLPGFIEDIKEKLATAGGAVQAINEATVAAEEIVKDADAETVEVEVVSDQGLVAALFSMAPGFLSRIMLSLILMFFLISSGDMFLIKTVQSFERFADKRRAVEVLHAVEERLGHYLGGIAIINAGLGVSVAIAMWFWGMPSVLLLGFMAFALNFVPFLGGLIGATMAAAVAFVSLESTWPAAGVFATYIVLTSIEGQFVTPMVMSRRLRLNTTVVFLSVAFFAWIWSVMGMIVALPILIVIKIVCDETNSFQTLSRFLSDAGQSGPKTTDKVV
ncbi:AI-2E family transporter [uncultured Roseobacter sp.]|uniref:AI-2E family transporter n=1 Tax=uncultured Roseobacter sp. TaxID=114847 RepID=UPI0026309ED2|nr:AI-2E family transporter [uncultured Roseobacter sp.]